MAVGLRAIDPGLLTTVQDLGRPGYREWGVPVGGAFDLRSSAVANALLGNDPSCGVLELTLTGGVFVAESPLAISLAGASIDAAILASDGRDRPFRSPGCGMIRAGEKLIVGPIRGGARTYLAVRGGWQTPVRLGSRSTETRLLAGERVPAAATSGEIASRHLRDWGWIDPTSEPIRVIGGPDRTNLEDFDPTWWDGPEWRIDSKSNRMGLRLEGPPIGLDPWALAERLSAPVAPGALQVAGGRFIILGVACGTMGGYPHVAHVIWADLGRLGQLRPGDVVRFQRIELDEARKLDAEARQGDRAFLARVAELARDWQ